MSPFDPVSLILGWFRSRKASAPSLTREQAMAARPFRNPGLEWSERDDGDIEVILPRRKDVTGRALGWFMMIPDKRPVTLDLVGGFVWKQCDGTHSVTDLVDLMADEFKVGRREIEASLTQYLKTLGSRGMIGFLMPKEVADQLSDRDRKALGVQDLGEPTAEGAGPAQGGTAEMRTGEGDGEEGES